MTILDQYTKSIVNNVDKRLHFLTNMQSDWTGFIVMFQGQTKNQYEY